MSPPIILRPIPNDEHPWMERHSELVLWGAFAAALISVGALVPGFLNESLHGDHHWFWSVCVVAAIGIQAVSKSYHLPRKLADRQLQQLIITKSAITLKRLLTGDAPEQVIWSLRRSEIGGVSLVVAAGSSVFRLRRSTESRIWRFIQWLGVRDGESLQAFSWVNDARADVQNRPAKLSDFSLRTRKSVIADMWASDLGQALIQSDYGPE